MLLQFKVKNFLSFHEETVLDLTTIQAYKEHEYNIIHLGNGEKVNKVVAIYGANASGKTNLMVAFHNFVNIIIESMNNKGEHKKNTITELYCPYFNDKESTEFEVTILLDGYEYRYGFGFNDKAIVDEWLYRRNLATNRTVIILERDAHEIKLGALVRKECSKYKDQIPAEALALSFYNKLKLNNSIFQEVYTCITNIMITDSNNIEDIDILNNMLIHSLKNNKEKLLVFLQAIDTGIQDLFYEMESEKIRFFSKHQDCNGTSCTINLLQESKGTLKAIAIFGLAQMVIEQKSAMIVDELDAKLHPLLLKFIIDLFYKSNSNAQLIYTTHDTTLLDKKFFRRDQIYFVQKDKNGCSELSSLSDFKVRSDASFEKDYLAGVYGGIPFLKDI